MLGVQPQVMRAMGFASLAARPSSPNNSGGRRANMRVSR